MTKAKRKSVETWARAFKNTTGEPLKLDAEKFAKFERGGVDMTLFAVREAETVQ